MRYATALSKVLWSVVVLLLVCESTTTGFLANVPFRVVASPWRPQQQQQCSTTTSSAISMQLMPTDRRSLLMASLFGSLFGGNSGGRLDVSKINPSVPGAAGPTNQIVAKVQGIRRKRLGGSDIVVSEMGLGTQRWVSDDFNAPDETTVYNFLDKAVLQGGINLIDTAEQYPIPSDGVTVLEGDCERVIGRWIKMRKVPRDKVVIASKITGGRNVTPKNIQQDCEGSLKRLGTDYIDIYQLHWPQRYSPQSNWGQSLSYNLQRDASPYWRQGGGGPTTFEDLCLAMEKLIQQGKIRGWGLCNDNAYGLTACTRTAKALGTTPPCSLQGDYSLLDRKSDENGVAEAASPYNENVGFVAYNALAGGMLTGKYMQVPAALDDLANPQHRERARESLAQPRGRMDTRGWGSTLYRYRTEAAVTAIAQYNDLAKQAGMTLTEMSLRWCKERTLVTTTLVGHSNLDHLEQSLRYFSKDEPLSDDLMWEIDRIHLLNRLPLFSSTRVGRDWNGEGEIGETIP